MFAEVRLRSGSGYSTITVLRNVSNLTFNTAFADIGAISFTMPLADAQSLGVDANSVIEIMPNGQSVSNMWFTLDSSQSATAVDGAGMVTFSGRGLINWLTDTIVYPSTWHPTVTPSDYIISVDGSRTQIVPRNYILISSTVTFTDSSNLVTTPAAHNLAVGDAVQFGSITTTTGISANTQYYVKSTPTNKTLTLSATPGGTTINLVNNGTGTVLTKNFTSYTDATKATINGHSFEDATPGFILQTLVARGVERGGLAWLDVSSFSGTTDTAGAGWSSTLTTTYTNGTTLLQVIQDLATRRLIDYKMDQNSLKVYNYGSQATHYTADQITLRRGKQVTEQTQTKDASTTGTSILIIGDANALEELSDSTLETAFGRRREQLVSQGGITDIPTLNLLAGAQLNISGHIQTEDTLGITDNDILPWINFADGDWVWEDINGTLKNVQILQIAASLQDANNLQIGLTLGDKIRSKDEKNQRLIDNITGQNSGNYGALPNQNDFKPPAAPSGITAAATAYRDQNGIDAVQVTVSWTAPSTNSDGTTLTDLDRYEVQYQTAGDNWSITSTIPGSTVPLAAFLSNLPTGVSFVARVRAIDSDGNASPWALSNTISALPKVTTTPSVPSTPTLTAAIQSLKVNWDGLNSSAGLYDASWDHTDIHLSTTSGFTPSSSTKVGFFSTLGGTFTVTGLSNTNTYYCKLVAVDKSGNVSAGSTQSTGVSPTQVGSSDLAANSVGATQIQNGVITGAKVANGTINTNNLTVAAFGESVAPNGSFEEVTTNSGTDTTGAAGWKFLTYPGSSGVCTCSLDTSGTNSAAGTNAVALVIPSGTNGGVIGMSTPIPTANPDVWFVQFKTKASSALTGRLKVIASLGDTVAESATLSHSANGTNVSAALAEDMNGLTATATAFDLTTGYLTWEVGFTVPNNGGGNQYKWLTLFIGVPTGASLASTVTVYFDSVVLQPVGGSATITNLSASKITAGTLSADVVVGSRIKTADTGARVELSSTGFSAYDANDNQTVNIDSSTGSASFLGSITGSSITGGNAASAIITDSQLSTTDFYVDTSGGSIRIYQLSGQTVVGLSTAGASTWTVPVGVTGVKVECYGAGGGGGANSTVASGGQFYNSGGGGGGAYARANFLAVTPGDSIPYTVGAGGAGGTSGGAGGFGGVTKFGHSDEVAAAGGAPGVPNAFGVGGAGGYTLPAGTGSENDVYFRGGQGGAGAHGPSSSLGGGGGGESGQFRGSGNPGGAASGSTGGSGGGGTPGGNGGAGGDSTLDGNPGVAPVGGGSPSPGGGGGGSGGRSSGIGATHSGGAGADGLIVLTYGGTYTLVASITSAGGTDVYSGTSFPGGMRLYRPDLIGVIGGYFEEFTLSNQNISDSTNTNVGSLTRTTSYSDYSGVMTNSTGTWTCPANGIYTFTFKCTFSSWVSASDLRLSISNNTTGINIGHIRSSPVGATNVQNSVTCTKFVAAGDTVNFVVRQATGSTQTLSGSDGYISILRQS